MRLFLGFTYDGPECPDDADLLRVPPLGEEGVIKILSLLRHKRQRFGSAENMIGNMSGAFDAARRASGLYDYGTSLRRRNDA